MELRDRAIALLIIGESFRSPQTRAPCTSASIDAQREASRSYMKQVVHPLQAQGNRVDLFMTLPNCTDKKLTSRMLRWLPASKHAIIQSTSMKHGWRAGYSLVQEHMKTTKASYDFIFQGRHDILVADSILTWPSLNSNASRLLFEKEARYCRGGCNMGSQLAPIVRSCGLPAPPNAPPTSSCGCRSDSFESSSSSRTIPIATINSGGTRFFAISATTNSASSFQIAPNSNRCIVAINSVCTVRPLRHLASPSHSVRRIEGMS